MPIRRTFMLGFGVITLFLLFLSGCLNQSPVAPGLDTKGTLVAHTGCKNFNGGGSAPGILTAPESGQECIEYTYVGNVLRIKHINAAFNCCLETIVGNVSLEGGVIRIESEGILANGLGCHCDCLYDVEYEILNLPPSVYVIVGPTFSRSFEIDLRNTASDRYCEPRNGYPWNINTSD